jgi:alanine racemase
VALPEEGIELRHAGVACPILVMGAYVPETAAICCRYDLAATMASAEQIDRAEGDVPSGHRLKVHLKVDSGMGRLGVLPAEALACGKLIATGERLELEGLYSHLATADDLDSPYVGEQRATFDAVIRAFDREAMLPPHRHLLNSSGLLHHDVGATTLARVGLGLYGVYPTQTARDIVDLKPALSFKTRVVSMKRVPAATPVSYGRTYVTSKETTLASLPAFSATRRAY